MAAGRWSIGSRLIGPPGGSVAVASGLTAYRLRRRGSMAARRAGRTKDIAEAIIALLRNGFISGTVLRRRRTPARLVVDGNLDSRK